MPNITDLVQIIAPDKDDEVEDIFACAPGLIFTDDLRNLHGSPDSLIVYKNARFGNIELTTADPSLEDERQLFSHYLWNAGIKLAELISQEEALEWSVKDQPVLELGAGVGLGGITATLAGASSCIISDYPSPVVLENIRRNTTRNIPASFNQRYQVEGHEWGVLDDRFALSHQGSFSRILAADCFWMPSQHENLVHSMLHFLSASDDSARIFAIAGFHTGRARLAAFFTEAQSQGLEIDEIYEEDAEGRRRTWQEERDGGREDHTERKKWLVISRLRPQQEDMSLEQSQNSIRNARSLATKLYGQCRDSVSSYRDLAPSLRKLRNALEEIEELILDGQTEWMVAPRFVLQIDSCNTLLQELDLTLQSHRCSTHKWQEVLQQTILKIQQSISTSTSEFSTLYDSIANSPEQPSTSNRISNEVALPTSVVAIPFDVLAFTLPKSGAPDELEEQEMGASKGGPRKFSWQTDDTVNLGDPFVEPVPALLSAEESVVGKTQDPRDTDDVQRTGAKQTIGAQQRTLAGSAITDHLETDRKASVHTQEDLQVHSVEREAISVPDNVDLEHTIPLPDSPANTEEQHGPADSRSIVAETSELSAITPTVLVAAVDQGEPHDSSSQGVEILLEMADPSLSSPTKEHITILLDPAVSQIVIQSTAEDLGLNIADEQADRAAETRLIAPRLEADDTQTTSEAVAQHATHSTPLDTMDKVGTKPSTLSAASDMNATTSIIDAKSAEDEPTVEAAVLSSAGTEHKSFDVTSAQQETLASPMSAQQGSSTSEVTLTPSTFASGWRSPFSVFDPLSVDIESASNFLLGSDGTKSPSADVQASAYATPVEATPPNSGSAYDEALKSEASKSEQGQSTVSQETDGLGITVAQSNTDSTSGPVAQQQQAITVAAANTVATDLGRTDSVHTATKTAVANAVMTASIVDHKPTLTLTSAHIPDTIDEVSTANGSPLHLKSKWLSLRPNSVPVQRSVTLAAPRSRFSLPQQLRKVNFKTRARAGEPPRAESSSPIRSIRSNGLPLLAEVATANESQPCTEQDTRGTPRTNETMTPPVSFTPVSVGSTPKTSPQVSPSVSPMTKNKSLPPPPPPLRAPPVIPEVQEPDPPIQTPTRLYRIANPSPPSLLSTISDDLYASSRPPSPKTLPPIEPLPKIEIEHIAATSPRAPHDEEESNTTLDLLAEYDGDDHHEDETPTELHNELGTPTKELHSPPRQSADEPLSSRYFRIELDEPENNVTRSRSMSTLPNPEPAMSEEAIVRSSGDKPASNAIPTSYYHDEKKLVLDTSVGAGQVAIQLQYSADDQRLIRICKYWQKQQWDAAELYLRKQMGSIYNKGNVQAMRRVRHMQGVCASIKGQWQRALPYFISVLQTPIKNVKDLDEGDFAALYWLGDTYALLNRRTEALLAYSLAAQINSNEGERAFGQTILLNEEQGAMLLGATPQELKACWDKMINSTVRSTDSILDRSVMEPSMMTRSLELAAIHRTTSITDASTRSRASILCELDDSPPMSEYVAFKITLESFDERGPWPLRYDPYFAAGNVARGRLCDQTTDLMGILATNPSYRIPRNGPIGTTRLDCFTCNHLDWLIVAIRQCLTFLEMRWEEVATDQGTWFLVRFAINSKNIIAANYFAISLFKQSVRSGYGVEVCVDGVRSARVLNTSPEYINGVHHSCEKRLRKLVKDYLAHAYKLWLRDGKKVLSPDTSQPTTPSIREQADGLVRRPTLPIRPKALYG
ncbi:hypothetical protein AMS68_001102 [Peltaster fructicola]|uniref:Uncharacterized protein n=1 Tax=Peltaster fructicola TaxID=286661 RepID=A0A6H0XLS8_9PEZI|nr:hypothetical protein AMS68_001102 [Peltaster fructicola]